jgi:hypothetical protein
MRASDTPKSAQSSRKIPLIYPSFSKHHWITILACDFYSLRPEHETRFKPTSLMTERRHLNGIDKDQPSFKPQQNKMIEMERNTQQPLAKKMLVERAPLSFHHQSSVCSPTSLLPRMRCDGGRCRKHRPRSRRSAFARHSSSAPKLL